MEKWQTYLSDDAVRGLVLSTDGTQTRFLRRGVIDLFELLTHSPQTLCGATLIDRVIGRGAALLAVQGGVAEVCVLLISRPALDVLLQAGVQVKYCQLADHIINRNGTDICPVERLTTGITDPQLAYQKIKEFLNKS